MVLAVLLDLDNTLLDSDMRVFLPPYFAALGQRMARFIDPDVFQRQLMTSTSAMTDNIDPGVTNQEAFERDFMLAFGDLATDLQLEFGEFYEEDFPRLRHLTSPRSEAKPLVEHLLGDGYRVVIATNPLFPRRAVEHRIDWAGLGGLPFAFLTTYENSHFCKPNPQYYLEILEKLECRPDEAVMIGDSLGNDILPSTKVGLHSFWVHNGSPDTQHDGLQGTLAECATWVTAGGLRAL